MDGVRGGGRHLDVKPVATQLADAALDTGTRSGVRRVLQRHAISSDLLGRLTVVQIRQHLEGGRHDLVRLGVRRKVQVYALRFATEIGHKDSNTFVVTDGQTVDDEGIGSSRAEHPPAADFANVCQHVIEGENGVWYRGEFLCKALPSSVSITPRQPVVS